MKLDIGSGKHPKKGYKTLDINKRYKPDVAADITKKIPIKSNKVEEIYCSHVLEHIRPEKLNKVLNEFWRILKHEGVLHIRVPHFTHTPYEFHYFHARYDFLKDYYTHSKSFSLVNKKLVFKGKYRFFQPIANRFPRIYENSFLRSFFFATELDLKLKANKKVKFTEMTGSS